MYIFLNLLDMDTIIEKNFKILKKLEKPKHFVLYGMKWDFITYCPSLFNFFFL